MAARWKTPAGYRRDATRARRLVLGSPPCERLHRFRVASPDVAGAEKRAKRFIQASTRELLTLPSRNDAECGHGERDSTDSGGERWCQPCAPCDHIGRNVRLRGELQLEFATVIATATNTVIATIPLGGQGGGVAIWP